MKRAHRWWCEQLAVLSLPTRLIVDVLTFATCVGFGMWLKQVIF